MKLKAIWENVKKWKVGKYFRELSTIIIGIAITFWGNNYINGINTKKALKQELKAIESELRENEKEIDEILSFYNDLSRYSDLLLKGNTQKVHNDSLKKYQYTLTTINSFNFKKDAFDMIKYSGSLKEINDVTSILNIMECYRLMEQAKEGHDIYMNQKVNMLTLKLLDINILDNIVLSPKENVAMYNFIIGFNGMERDFLLSKKQINKVLNMNISEK